MEGRKKTGWRRGRKLGRGVWKTGRSRGENWTGERRKLDGGEEKTGRRRGRNWAEELRN